MQINSPPTDDKLMRKRIDLPSSRFVESLNRPAASRFIAKIIRIGLVEYKAILSSHLTTFGGKSCLAIGSKPSCVCSVSPIFAARSLASSRVLRVRLVLKTWLAYIDCAPSWLSWIHKHSRGRAVIELQLHDRFCVCALLHEHAEFACIVELDRVLWLILCT